MQETDVVYWKKKYFYKPRRAAHLHAPPVLFYISPSLEPPHIQILINQDAVCRFQVELHGAFCFQLNHEQFFAAGEAWFIAQIDEGRIERLLPVGVQAIVGQVLHLAYADRLDADELIRLLVVRQGET